MEILRKKTMPIFIISALILAVLPGLYNGLAVRRYEVTSDKVEGDIRLALVSDLHSCKYGEKAQELIEALIAEKPDIVLLGGDIFDDRMPDMNTADFLRGIAGKFPIYYVTGNHECRCDETGFNKKMDLVESLGIKRLNGDADVIEVNGSHINICGADDPEINARLAAGFGYYDASNKTYAKNTSQTNRAFDFNSQFRRLSDEAKNGHYSVILCHRPELYEMYINGGFDLALCGHAHGGQWRIPGILNGLIAPNQGMFPKYAGGLYDFGDMKMVVSRGLARESTIVPRIYNRPELVIVSISNN